MKLNATFKLYSFGRPSTFYDPSFFFFVVLFDISDLSTCDSWLGTTTKIINLTSFLFVFFIVHSEN